MVMDKTIPVAVLIPCKDEAPAIKNVVEGFREALPKAKIVVGDNLSTDGTGEVALEMRDPPTVLWCDIPGKAAALKRMVRSVPADWYIFIDGDGTCPPEDAGALLAEAMAHHCMAVGRRRFDRENMKPLNRLGTIIFDALATLRTRRITHDCLSGYRVVPGDLAAAWAASSRYDGFEVEAELTLMARKLGWQVHSVPCGYLPRAAGTESKLSAFRDGWRILKALLGPVGRDVP